MYLIPDKSKLSNAGDLRASHPSMRRTMESQPNQPVVHVEFGAFDTPGHMMLNDDDDQYHTNHQEIATQRYVAGEQFYNYEMYGSLRKGNPVSFFSWHSVGLMAAVFSSVLSYQCLQSTVRPYMASQLNFTDTEAQSVTRLVEVPMTLSFFIGLLMDGYPIRGLRRKGYMVLGLVIYAVAVLALGGLSMYFESTKERDQWLVILSTVLISIASFGCIITYLCVHTRVIELAQREPLRRRGAIVADYLIFRRLTSYVGGGYALFIYGWSGAPSKEGLVRIPFSTAMFILAFICTAPLPIILRYWKEEHYNLSTTLKVRGKIFWKIMQQKAVWRILMFIVLFTFFLTINSGDSVSIIRGWTGAQKDNAQVVRYISDTIGILTILAWRTFFMNTLWPRFYCWAPILQVLPGVIITILVCLDINQDRYLYRSVVSVTNIADSIQLLNPIVPLIEIIQEGSEGATVGLTLTLYRIVQVFVRTNSNGLFKGSNFYNTTLARPGEDADTRVDVMWTMMVVYAINLVALTGLFFLPSQKLDAQQLRMYGGFTKAASSAIVVFCLSFFLYSLAINIMTFIPATKCFGIVGACPTKKP